MLLYLQLYSKYIQLQAKENIQSNFVFRLGELHILFAIEKNINCSTFLKHDEVGKEMFDTFKLEKLQGEKSVWDPVVKRKLPTFAEITKRVQMKINDKIMQLKKEKQLITKFIVASRTRDDIYRTTSESMNLVLYRDHCFAKMEALYLALINQQIYAPIEIEQLMKEETQEQFDLNLNDEQPGRKVIILDGMSVVNRIKEMPEIKTCKDLAMS